MSAAADRASTLTRALEASVERDLDALAAVLTDDVRAWTPGIFVESKGALLAALDARDDTFSELRLDVRPLDVLGDVACAEWTVTMTQTGPLTLSGATVEATGAEVTLHGVTVAEFRDDLICAVRQYWDELSVFDQLGLLEADEAS